MCQICMLILCFGETFDFLAPSCIAFMGKMFPKTVKSGHITKAISFQLSVNAF